LRRIAAIMVLICVLLSCGCSADKQAIQSTTQSTVIRIATDLTEHDAAYRQLKRFQQKLQDIAGDSIKLKLYQQGEWDSDNSLLDYLEAGSVEMVCLSTNHLTAKIPQYTLYSYPALFSSADDVAVYALSSQGQAALAINPEYQSLGFLANGYIYFQHLFLADNMYSYQGSNFYSLLDTPAADSLKALGIRLYNQENNSPGLNHVADEGYLNTLVNLNVVNESSYLTDPDFLYSLEVCLVNQEFWQSLSLDEQNMLTEAFNHSLKEECTYQNNRYLSEILADGGISFYPWSKERKQEIYYALRWMSENYITKSQNPLGSYFLPQGIINQ